MAICDINLTAAELSSILNQIPIKMLTGNWQDDGSTLILTHMCMDLLFLLVWSIYSMTVELNISLWECSPLSTTQFCTKVAGESAFHQTLYPVGVIAIVLGIVYTYFLVDVKMGYSHPRKMFVWNSVHIHLMIALSSVFFGRKHLYMLLIPLIGILQDLYVMSRTSLSEHIKNKPASSSLNDDGQVWGCFRTKKRGRRCFLCLFS